MMAGRVGNEIQVVHRGGATVPPYLIEREHYEHIS